MKVSRALVALYAVVALCATIVASSSYRSIEQHLPYDYPFYMQFYAKVYDPALANDLAPYTNFCMRGHNAFFYGCDGASGINHGLHFDPIKYVLALAYEAFHSPLALSVIYILVFYSPLLYAAWLIRKKCVGDETILALSMAAYSLYPAALTVVNDGLRLMTFFFPFFMLFMLAILYRRSKAEHFLFLNLLLVTREEGVLIAMAAIGFLFLRERLEKAGNLSLRLLANALLWIIPTAIYFRWLSASYVRFAEVASIDTQTARLGHTAQNFLLFLHAHPAFVYAGMALGIVLIGFAVRRSYHIPLARWVTGTVVGRSVTMVLVPIVLVVALLVLGWTAFPWTAIFIFNRMGLFTTVFTLLALLVMIETFVRGEAQVGERRAWKIALICFIGLSIAIQSFGPYSVPRLYAKNQSQFQNAQLVFFAHKAIDPVRDLVIGDERTSRVFYDIDKFVVYNGLPESVSATSSAQIASFAKSLFGRAVPGKTYIVALREDALTLSKLARQASLKLTTIAENDAYMFILCQK